MMSRRRNQDEHRMEGESSEKSGLLAKARLRTAQEQGCAAPASTSLYAASALGQAPYVALGNGVIVVQRKCSDWNC